MLLKRCSHIGTLGGFRLTTRGLLIILWRNTIDTAKFFLKYLAYTYIVAHTIYQGYVQLMVVKTWELELELFHCVISDAMIVVFTED